MTKRSKDTDNSRKVEGGYERIGGQGLVTGTGRWEGRRRDGGV